MNFIKINQEHIKQLIMTSVVSHSRATPVNLGPGDQNSFQSNEVFMKHKVERYYNLGVSLSRILGLYDCVNFVQYLLNLLEEYEVYITMQNYQTQYEHFIKSNLP